MFPKPEQVQNQPITTKDLTGSQFPAIQYHGIAQTKDHSYITQLPTYAQRGSAITKLMDKINSNPKYQALPDSNKEQVRANFYKKYVVPSYANYHLPVPDEKTWVGATAKANAFGHGDFTQKGAVTEGYQHYSVGVDSVFNNLKMFGAKISNKAFLGMYGLLDHFTDNNKELDPEAYKEQLAKYETPKTLAHYIDGQRARIQDDDFWNQTHPAHSVIGKLGSFTGEQVATLPLYEALGIEKLGGAVGLPITAKLAKSPIGQWVAKRLINATDGFTSTLVTSGGNKEEAIKGGLGFAIGQPIVDGASSLLSKVASAPFIKKWTANTIAMAGKPFAEELSKSALAEEEHEMAFADSGSDKSTGELLDRRKQVATGQRPQAIRDWYAAQQARAVNDSVMHKLHIGEKVSLNSISTEMYGKPLRGISQNQRQIVLAKRLSLINEAANEAPVHLPELTQNEAEDNINKARASNPQLDALMKYDEEHFGAKFAVTQADNQIKGTARDTGIRNAKGAGKNIIKAAKEAKPKGETVSLKTYSTARTDTLSYLRAPRNRAEFNAALSDRSKAGFDKVYQTLKAADKNLPFRFEKPEHRLLYHYALSKDLDQQTGKILRKRILNQMQKIQGYEHLSAADLRDTINKQAANLNAHITTYIKHGKIYNGDHIYASTSLGDVPSWTKWQHQMNSEVAQGTIASTEKALARHPEALRAYKSTIKLGKSIGKKITNPVEYEAYQNALKETSRITKKIAKGQNPTLFQ